MLDKIGAAIIDLDEERASALFTAVADDAILSVDPEPIFHTYEQSIVDKLTYLRGFRDAVNHLHDEFTGERNGAAIAPSAVASFQDTSAYTWGLHALGIDQSPLSGKGVKVAVLDTGFDLDHPDFSGRNIVSQTFIGGQSVDDRNGHGTHCVGTACGPRDPSSGPGYGIAYESDIYVGKVLSNQGSSLGR
ncbi:MAG: S8 family serine peptidase, partial [Planctomycetota bacterium]